MAYVFSCCSDCCMVLLILICLACQHCSYFIHPYRGAHKMLLRCLVSMVTISSSAMQFNADYFPPNPLKSIEVNSIGSKPVFLNIFIRIDLERKRVHSQLWHIQFFEDSTHKLLDLCEKQWPFVKKTEARLFFFSCVVVVSVHTNLSTLTIKWKCKYLSHFTRQILKRLHSTSKI